MRLAFTFIYNLVCKICPLIVPTTYYLRSFCKNQLFISMQIRPVFLSPCEHEPQLFGTGIPDHIVEVLFETVIVGDKLDRFVATRAAEITSVATGQRPRLPTKHAKIKF
jgi:hypothetical protein